MVVYMIIDIKIKDREKYTDYIEQVRSIVEEYKGRYIVRGGRIAPLSGNWHPERIVVIRFPSSDDVRKCFDSPEYRSISHLREDSTLSRSILVEGCT